MDTIFINRYMLETVEKIRSFTEDHPHNSIAQRWQIMFANNPAYEELIEAADELVYSGDASMADVLEVEEEIGLQL